MSGGIKKSLKAACMSNYRQWSGGRGGTKREKDGRYDYLLLANPTQSRRENKINVYDK
jgi:hypothetical protein